MKIRENNNLAAKGHSLTACNAALPAKAERLLNPKLLTGSGNRANPLLLDTPNNFRYISFFIPLFENLKSLKWPPWGPKKGFWALPSLNMFFDPRSHSMRKGCDGEVEEDEEKNGENSGSLSLCQSIA